MHFPQVGLPKRVLLLVQRIFYVPRFPADPLVRSECIRSFVCSLRALQVPFLGSTLIYLCNEFQKELRFDNAGTRRGSLHQRSVCDHDCEHLHEYIYKAWRNHGGGAIAWELMG